MQARPPRFSRWLLSRVVSDDDRAHLVLELDLELEERLATAGERSARRWYRSQCWRSLLPLLARRMERRSASSRSRSRSLPLRDLRNDVALALRGFRTRPGWTLAVVTTLALGLGAHQVVYAVVQSVVLRDFPYPEPDRIVRLSESPRDGHIPPGWTSIPNFLDWKREAVSFAKLALYRGRSMALTGDFEPEYIYTALVTDEFFDVFGTAPVLGRGFLPEDGAPGAAPVVVLSHSLWRSRFASDRSIVGGAVTVNGVPRTVVGVMPDGFTAPAEAIGITDLRMDLWVPLEIDGSEARGDRSFQPVARIAAGTNLSEARTEMLALGERLARDYPEANTDFATDVDGWHDVVVSDAKPVLFLLWGTCAFALLIACANVFVLWLNRALERGPEMALRAALGAGRGRLARQALTEALLIAAMGGLSGLLLARAALDGITALAPRDVPRLFQANVDASVWLLGLGLSTLVGLALAAIPALESSVLPSKPRGVVSSSRRRHRSRVAVVLAQVALSFALCVAAGLTGRSLAGLLAVSPGLKADGVIATTVALSWDRVSSIEERSRWVSTILDSLRALPSVESAAMINSLPFSGSSQQMPFRVAGAPSIDPGREPVAAFRGISPGYFHTMGIPLLRGRDFETSDLTEPRSVIVNETFARRFLPGADPLLASVVLSSVEDERALSIVGVVSDVKHYGLDRDARPEIYQPYTTEYLTSKSFVVRTSAPMVTTIPAIRDAIHAVDPDQPIRDMGPMADYVRRSLAASRFTAAVVAGITIEALVLASIGLFGTMSSWVSERRGELGIRLALGAGPRRVLRDVVRQSLSIAAAGVGLGIVLALFASRWITNLLYGVGPHDPVTLTAALALFAAVSFGASYLPARRAASIDPAIALRHD